MKARFTLVRFLCAMFAWAAVPLGKAGQYFPTLFFKTERHIAVSHT